MWTGEAVPRILILGLVAGLVEAQRPDRKAIQVCLSSLHLYRGWEGGEALKVEQRRQAGVHERLWSRTVGQGGGVDCKSEAAEPEDWGYLPPGVIREGTGLSVPLHCCGMMEQNPVGVAVPPDLWLRPGRGRDSQGPPT